MLGALQMEDSRKVVSYEEFCKRVEIESANLVYFDRLTKSEADKKALEYIKTKYFYQSRK